MTCTDFQAWLDTGAAAQQHAAASLHAADCARCARHWTVARHLDDLLAGALPPAPAGLASQVMQRVRESGAPAAVVTALPPTGFRWRQFLAEPAILFPGIAGGIAAGFALLAVLPVTAGRIRPGLAALRRLGADGAQSLTAAAPDGAAMPFAVLACAALACTAWFAARGPGIRAR